MKTVYVDLDPKAHEGIRTFLKGKAIENDDPIIDYDVVFKDRATDETILIYKDKIDGDIDTDAILEALRGVKFTKNVRTNGLVTQSEIIGYRPRLMGSNTKKTCSKTTFGNRYKDIEEELFKVANQAEKLYAEFAPERHTRHSELAEKVNTDYLMPETHFTSGIINKNNPLNYHLDTGNFQNVFSIMLGLKKNTAGGYLHIPELKINLKISNGSLSIFDGQSFVHGVTPIKSIGDPDESYRFTIVFYSLVQMWNCLETAAEVENAKRSEDRKLAKLLERIEAEKNENSNS